MSMIQNDWLDAIREEFKKPYYARLYKLSLIHICPSARILSSNNFKKLTSNCCFL